MPDPLAGAGGPRRRTADRPLPRRVGSFLVWWLLFMALWVWADDTILTSELLVGAGVAVLAAALVEVAQHQAESHIRIQIDWLGPAIRIPWWILRDTAIVLAALYRRLAHGDFPASKFEEEGIRAGDDSYADTSRRALLIGGKSAAPNTLALGVDRERDVIVLHHLVPAEAADD